MPHATFPNLLVDWEHLEGLGLPGQYRCHRISRLTTVGPGATVTLCDIPGPGCINHLWMTLGENNYRGIVVRMYWDDEPEPSVEAPITELFGVGHNLRYVPLSTPGIVVAPHNGLNLYFPMPFAHRARVVLQNENLQAVDGAIYFQADYAAYPEALECPLRFHAQWRRDSPAPRRARRYTVMEAAGRGYFVGMTYHLRVLDDADAWFHGGGDLILVDGGTSYAAALHGIGGEDFFGASWGIQQFQTPYSGCTLCDDRPGNAQVPGWQTGEWPGFGNCTAGPMPISHFQDTGMVVRQGEPRLSMYRFFWEAPIPFSDNLRVSFGAMANDISSVAYWYQTEPHHRFFRLPPADRRQPHSECPAAEYDVELLPTLQGTWAVLGPFAGGINQRFGPEAALAQEREIDLTEPVPTTYPGAFGLTPAMEDAPGQPRMVRWERMRTDLWWLDLGAAFMPKLKGPQCVQTVDGVAYLMSKVISTRDWRAALQVTFDDDLMVWLDEHLVWSGNHPHGHATVHIPVELRRGMNTLLLKTTNTANQNWHAWCLSLRICHKDGTPTDAVRYATMDGLPQSAAAGPAGADEHPVRM